MICDLETYGPDPAGQERPTLAQQHASGRSVSGILTLTLEEPLPVMKRLTEAVEEHWKGHAPRRHLRGVPAAWNIALL